jgi:putative flippase GtrA
VTGSTARRLQEHRQLIVYLVIGVSGVVLDLVLFLLLYNVVGLPEGIATVISTSAGIANNFLLNARFNFKTSDRLWGRFARFYLVGVAGILVTLVLFAVFSTWAGWDPNVVKVLSLPVVAVLQYSINRKWTFTP